MLGRIVRALVETGLGWVLLAFGGLAIGVGAQMGWWWLAAIGVAMVLGAFWLGAI